MDVSIPTILVVIACRVIPAGPPDQNADFTHHENLTWDTPNAMMVCRRHEIQMFDPAADQPQGPEGEPAPQLNPNFAQMSSCARAGVRLQMDWDDQHRNTPWRVWRIGCPAPIVDRATGKIVGYKLPECGHRDTVVCEVDSEI